MWISIINIVADIKDLFVAYQKKILIKILAQNAST